MQAGAFKNKCLTKPQVCINSFQLHNFMKTTLCLLVGTAIATSSISAQQTADTCAVERPEEWSIEFIKMTDEVQDILKPTRPEEPGAIPMPKFAVHTKNNKFVLTIGGVINPILGYDLGNNLYKVDDAGINFITQAIPVPATAGHKSDFFINPLNANVDLQVVGLGGTADAVTGYIKIGTDGNSSALKLKKAYVSWRGLTAGLKSTLMQDEYACQPPTIDPQGPAGMVSGNAYEISYKSKSYGGFRFAAGLSMPSFYSSNGVYRGHDYPKFDGVEVADYGDDEQVVPDIPAWVEYQHSDGNRIRFSALLRNFSYRDLVSGKTRHTAGYGVMLSGNLQPVEALTFYMQAAYGKGIGNYLQDIAGLPISFVPNSSEPGRMSGTPMMGLTIGASLNITPKLQFNVMASESRVWDVADYCKALDTTQNYKYGLYAAANMFYQITPWLQVGVEYLYGKRQTWSAGSGHDNRIQTQLAFSF